MSTLPPAVLATLDAGSGRRVAACVVVGGEALSAGGAWPRVRPGPADDQLVRADRDDGRCRRRGDCDAGDVVRCRSAAGRRTPGCTCWTSGLRPVPVGVAGEL